MGLWRRLFGGPRLPPLLFRVRIGTGDRAALAQGDVVVRGVRAPDGGGFHLRPVAAQGVVLVPWPGGRRAEFVLEKGDRAGRISLTADEAGTGLVHEVLLS
jgi:hypothetical protein